MKLTVLKLSFWKRGEVDFAVDLVALELVLVFEVGTLLLPLRRECLVFVPELVEIDPIEVVLMVEHKISLVAEDALSHLMSALLVLIGHSTALEVGIQL